MSNTEHIARMDKNGEIIQYVFDHLTETAAIAKKDSSKIDMGLCGELSGLIHDIGKYTDEFKKRIKGGEICDHSTQGAFLFFSLLPSFVEKHPDAGKLKFVNNVCQIISFISMCHHGGLSDVVSIDGEEKAWNRLHKEILPEDLEKLKCRSSVIMDIVKDIFSSDEFELECKNVFKLIAQNEGMEERLFTTSLLVKFLFSCIVDSDRVNAIESEHGPIKTYHVDWSLLSQALDSHIKSFPPNHLNNIRNEIYQDCLSMGISDRSFFKLCVPTGGGKTFSSLGFALKHAEHHRMERIIFVLPYISIIEQNAQTIRAVFKKYNIDDTVVLECHSNITKESEDDERHFLTDNWNGQIIFTTLVQFLENVYKDGTKGVRRFHNMANAVIIFDEVQSLPIKTVHMTNMLMRFLVSVCHSSVVLCTATQPLLDKLENKNRSLPASVEITKNNYNFAERTQIIDKTCMGGYEYEEIASFALQQMATVNSILIICNTRKCAEKLYALLSVTEYTCFYLSTNLCPEHRSDVINKIKQKLKSGEKLFCVSTQLIEAGVDIDFNCVIRANAGLDSIIQAAGRCNREGILTDLSGEPIKGNVYILNFKDEHIESLPDIVTGQEVTRRILREAADKTLPSIAAKESIDKYYEYYFFKQKQKMDYCVTAEQCGTSTTLFDLLSKNTGAVQTFMRKNNGKMPHLNMKQAFNTAGSCFSVIDKNQIGVLVPYGNGKVLIQELDTMEKREIYRKTTRYTVNVYQNALTPGFVYRHSIGLYVLCDGYYDEVLGLITKKGDAKTYAYGIY